MVEPNVVRIVEAALFSAGKPLLVQELAEKTGLGREEVREACKALEKEYEASPSALEVGKAGDKWAMQLKARWAPHAALLAPGEVPRKTLKTLALIAFHQPILQSELKRMVGDRVYDHMHELHERGLVVAREHGPTKLLTTSERFPEYFGIPETEPERIRTFLADKLGIKVGPKQDKVPPPELAEPDAQPVAHPDAQLDAGSPAPAEGAPEGSAPEGAPPAEAAQPPASLAEAALPEAAPGEGEAAPARPRPAEAAASTAS